MLLHFFVTVFFMMSYTTKFCSSLYGNLIQSNINKVQVDTDVIYLSWPIVSAMVGFLVSYLLSTCAHLNKLNLGF